MISKSTKKNRRKMAFANENRARLILEFVDSRCDFWYLGIKQTWRSVQWIEIYGKKNAIRRFRNLSSLMGSKNYDDVYRPKY